MVKRLSERLAVNIGKHLRSSEGEVEVFSYGLEVFFSALLKFFLILTLARVLGLFLPALAVLVSISGFRVFGGGAHLSTYSRCLLFGGIVVLGLSKVSMVPIPNNIVSTTLLAAVVLAVIDIIFWVPSGTEKKAITDPVLMKAQKLKTLGFLAVWLFMALAVVWVGNWQYAFALTLGALMGTLSLTPLGYRFTHNLDTAFDWLQKGGEYMRRMTVWAASALASLAVLFANIGVGPNSLGIWYEPDIPETLKAKD